MGFISELLTVVPKRERDGIRLDESEYWAVQPVSEPSQFLRALPDLVPEGSTLYLEGTTEPVIREFLQARPADDPVPVSVGTIWPRPDRNHMALTDQNVTDLADLVEAQRVVNLCTHIHVYRARQVLLEWYDAFTGDPIRLHPELRGDDVARFAHAIKSSYRLERYGS